MMLAGIVPYSCTQQKADQPVVVSEDGLDRTSFPIMEPDSHFTTDMTNQSIAWVKAQQALQPDKPFFIYYAPGLHMLHIMLRRNGSQNIKENLTRAGI
jgi:hypothetical protein